MQSSIIERISNKTQLSKISCEAVMMLHTEGATIPFIARYRKDKHGNLDEVQITQIIDTYNSIVELDKRKEAIIHSIEEQQKMTDELLGKIYACETLTALEDLYLPYKPKRKTRAQMAREKGLEPLSEIIIQQEAVSLQEAAVSFLNDEIVTIEDALQGARDIIAEMISESAEIRESIRNLYHKEAILYSNVYEDKKELAVKYKDYFNSNEKAISAPSHRILAIFRGYAETLLKVDIEPDTESALYILEKTFVKNKTECGLQVAKACKEAYSRLLKPSMELEFKMFLKNKADEEAIQVFALNLKQLLLSSPLGGKSLIAIDPGYKTGCKVVCLNKQGDLCNTSLIYIHEKNKLPEAESILKALIYSHQPECFAVGDGTAGRETESFIRTLNTGIPIYMVNEDGASVYSAGEVAREEFPDQDITVRGAVSIGRRLMDPLAELVKIDPKSIGVGQYQHDVNAFKLKQQLDATVEHCVNAVGVNVNTASKQLLSYVSGIGPSLAQYIIDYRKQHGPFTTRNALKQVPRMGDKAFEQCAGFLRIPNGANILDSSAVHPENYELVATMAHDVNCDIAALIGNTSMLSKINKKNYASIGEHTFHDIINELRKPGLDPRGVMEHFEFAQIYKIEDVHVGMILPGKITNITRFGAFVDIGVKQDGLVHVSELAHKFVKDPAEVVKLNDTVQVKVLEVDISRKRILLSIKQTQDAPAKNSTFKKQNSKPERTMNDALRDLKNKFGNSN